MVTPRAGGIGEAIVGRFGVTNLPRGVLFGRPTQTQATPPVRTRTNAYGMTGRASVLNLPMPGARLRGYAGPGVQKLSTNVTQNSELMTARISTPVRTASTPDTTTAAQSTMAAFGNIDPKLGTTVQVAQGSVGQMLMWRSGLPVFRIGTTVSNTRTQGASPIPMALRNLPPAPGAQPAAAGGQQMVPVQGSGGGGGGPIQPVAAIGRNAGGSGGAQTRVQNTPVAA